MAFDGTFAGVFFFFVRGRGEGGHCVVRATMFGEVGDYIWDAVFGVLVA